MRTRLNWILSAAIGIGGMGMAGCNRNDSGSPQAGTTGKDASPGADSKVLNNKSDAASVAGSKIPGDQIGTMDLGHIYATAGETAEAAFTKGGFKDLVERLSSADRTRIGKFAEGKFDDLDGRIDQLNKDYNAKYNGKFKLDNTKVFENWAQVQKTGENKDQTMANLTIPASHGMPAVTVPMVKHLEMWRIDLPDEITGDQLKQSLLNHLTMLDQMKDTWPNDQLEAQRVMVHHVLMAVMNQSATTTTK